MDKIHVLNSYDVLVGTNILDQLTKIVASENYSKTFVITTSIVGDLHFKKVKEVLPNAEKILIEISEQEKNIESVKEIWEKLFSLGCDRKSLIIIMGGGGLGDVAGFAASTYMRGIPFIQIPTTLLSQVDSSVGGKNGINFKEIKNLIGTFNQPITVLCEIDFLSTLPDRTFLEGFGEIIKHGIVADKTYFDFVTSKKPREFNTSELSKIILGSINIKAKIVNDDEKEKGIRKLINFGHTIGHGVEALSQNTDHPLSHGEAISIGMVVEAKISMLLGLISNTEVSQIIQSLNNAGLPTSLPNISVKDLIEKINSDKKIEAGSIKWTLIEEIGKGIINQEVDEKIIITALKSNYELTN